MHNRSQSVRLNNILSEEIDLCFGVPQGSILGPNLFSIDVNSEHISPKTHVNNLGVYVDRYMLFDVHVSEMNKKIMGLLMFIR